MHQNKVYLNFPFSRYLVHRIKSFSFKLIPPKKLVRHKLQMRLNIKEYYTTTDKLLIGLDLSNLLSHMVFIEHFINL